MNDRWGLNRGCTFASKCDMTRLYMAGGALTRDALLQTLVARRLPVAGVCVFVCAWILVCVRVCMCVCACDRERVGEKEKVYVCERGSDTARKSMFWCVGVCVFVRVPRLSRTCALETVCMCVWERETLHVYVSRETCQRERCVCGTHTSVRRFLYAVSLPRAGSRLVNEHAATHCITLYHAVTHCTHCNSLQHTATHCNALQHRCQTQAKRQCSFDRSGFTAFCTTLQHTAAYYSTLQHDATYCNSMLKRGTTQVTSTRCNTLWFTATYCNILQHTTRYCTILRHTATHCKTLHHTATHRTTLHHQQCSRQTSQAIATVWRCYPPDKMGALLPNSPFWSSPFKKKPQNISRRFLILHDGPHVYMRVIKETSQKCPLHICLTWLIRTWHACVSWPCGYRRW